jgi:hypothetical protein
MKDKKRAGLIDLIRCLGIDYSFQDKLVYSNLVNASPLFQCFGMVLNLRRFPMQGTLTEGEGSVPMTSTLKSPH